MFFSENVISPDARFWLSSNRAAEIVTYVFEGSLLQKDASGFRGVIYAGEFQRMNMRERAHHSAANTSRTYQTHIFQMWLRSSANGVDSERDQERFSMAERRDGLCVVASPDGRDRSLRLHEDVVIHSAVLDTGRHVIYEIAHDRVAWLHVVRGVATLADEVLSTGDSVGVTDDRAVSFTAREDTEILLLDMHEQRSESSMKEVQNDRSARSSS